MTIDILAYGKAMVERGYGALAPIPTKVEVEALLAEFNGEFS